MSNVDKNAEILLVNPTASGGTINLPLTTSLPYRTLTIKHIGSTSLNGITLSTQGSDAFEDGTTSFVITRITTFVTFYANASANRWVLVGGTNSFTQTISSLTVNTINGQTYIPISPSNLVSTAFLDTTMISTVNGINNTGYLSTINLPNLVSTAFLDTTMISTVNGINNTGYLSTINLPNIVSTAFLDRTLISTVNGINNTGYLSTINLPNLVSTAFLDRTLISTVNGINNTGYLSTAVTQIIAGSNITISPLGGQGIVTINASGGSGGGSGDVTSTNLTSTTLGLGTLGYISSLPRFLSTNAMFTSSFVASTISTTNTLFTNTLVARSTNISSLYVSNLTAVTGYISSLSIDELLLGTGDGWTDTGPLRATYISSIQTNTGSLYATTLFVGNTSTLNQIRFWGLQGNYNNTILAEVSTGTVVGAQEFLVFKGSSASDRIRFQTTGDIRFEPQVAAREFSTATALATPTMILQSNLVGIATATPVATLDVRGNLFATQISTPQLFVSSLVAPIISSQQLTVSTILTNTISTTNFIFTNSLRATSATTGAFFTSSLVASTISTTNTLFTNSLRATSATTGAFFTSSLVASTISTTNTLFTNVLVARSTNLSSVYISSLTAVTGYISSLTTDTLTIGDGNGWMDFGAARAIVFSSIQENTGALYATTAFIGNTSTLNQIRFWGLFGNYNNTILAEVSTGTAVGAQEFLVFKGSSASDRIRFQTTGDIRFEPQVAAREFSTATALATPTMILQSNLVGIATATPIAPLDVRGTAFATTLSTPQLFISSINGSPFSIVSPNNLVSTGLLDSTLRSTTGRLQSNIEAWSQYTATNDVTLSNGTSIKMTDGISFVQIKASGLNIVDTNGGYGDLTMGSFINMNTSSSQEYYTQGFSPLGTGTISSFLIVRGDGVTAEMAPLYISSLYLGNLGGTVAGQLTTDSAATDLFWNGSKLNDQSGGGGVTTQNLTSTTIGLGTVNYISGPIIQATSVFATDTLLGVNTIASTMYMFDTLTDLIENFPPWVNSNQISGSDPEPAPLRLDVFGSARILKNLYVGSTTTVLTTTGVQASQISSFHTTASTMTLSDKGPLFASTNSVTSITDIFLNDSYVGQRVPAAPVIISTIFENMLLQPEFLGMHFLLTNSDSNFSQLYVRADATFVENVPDGWYCYLKQILDSNYFNSGVAAETDVGNVPLPILDFSGGSNFQGAMKFIVSGGFKIPY